MNPKNTTSRSSVSLAAALVTIQFLTILSACAGIQQVAATNNNSAANISNTTSAAIPSDANAPTMPAP
jgi:hypothetical protein